MVAHLRPRARIIRTIGDRLISGPEAALIELVKNAYDADSSVARISIAPTAAIVSDTGHGMLKDQILESWLEPATDEKELRRLSPAGRVMLGAKGIGRFAAAKLGKNLDMRTTAKRPDGKLETTHVQINWDVFLQKRYLDQVDIDIESELALGTSATGTTMEISDLHEQWSKSQLERLVRELKRLVSPRGRSESGFAIHLDLSAFTQDTVGFDGQALVSGTFSDDMESDERTLIRPFQLGKFCDYRLKGKFDRNGKFTGAFSIEKGDTKPTRLVIPASAVLDGEATCGTFRIHLNIYDREHASILALFKRMGQEEIGIRAARQILDGGMGIAIYRQGFRIRPYGDPETDWLELERRRVQDPSLRLGLNQVSGVVEVGTESESSLIERSSREGLELNGSYSRMVRLVRDVLAHVEQRRKEFREKAGLSRKMPGDLGAARQKASMANLFKAIKKLPPRHRKSVEKAAEREVADMRAELDDFDQYKQVLESRAALGLVVAEVLHDGRKHLSDINSRAKAIADGAAWIDESTQRAKVWKAQLPDNAQGIVVSGGRLNRLFKMLDPISGRRRGRPKAFSAIEIAQRCTELLKESIARARISVSITKASSASDRVYGYEDDLQAALLNVIDNAVYWLGFAAAAGREITVNLDSTPKTVRLTVANNGPPIDETYATRLFDAGFTLKSDGTGLGLSIAREALHRSKGDIAYDHLASDTTFVIRMPAAGG